MHDEPMAALPDVPTTADALKSGWTLAAWITISAPAGLPEDIRCAYEAAVERAFETQQWADFKASRGSEVVWRDSAETREMMRQADADLGATMEAIGLAR